MFTPHTKSEREEMLRAVGVKTIEELFDAVPKKYRFPKLDLPPQMTEMEVVAELSDLANGNGSVKDMACFLGAGAYNHYIPSAVNAVISGVNSLLPIHHISRRSLKERYRRFLNINP